MLVKHKPLPLVYCGLLPGVEFREKFVAVQRVQPSSDCNLRAWSEEPTGITSPRVSACKFKAKQAICRAWARRCWIVELVALVCNVLGDAKSKAQSPLNVSETPGKY